MSQEKDYLGEKLRLVERGRENAYFRKLDQELLEQLRKKDAEELERLIRAYTRMRCPKCGEPLQQITYHRFTLEECPGCGGLWLDKEEFEKLVGPKEEGWLRRFYESFGIPPKP